MTPIDTLLKNYDFVLRPFDHQVEALRRAWRRAFYAYLMDMGTGKTKTALDEIGMLWGEGEIVSVLVVAPKGVYTNWPLREIPTHVPQRIRDVSRMATYDGSDAHYKRAQINEVCDPGFAGLSWLFMNGEALGASDRAARVARAFVKRGRTLILVDESTCIKNWESQLALFLTALGKEPNVVYRRILTGHVAPNGPLDVFGQFEFLQPGCLATNFFTFRGRYSVMEEKWLGQMRYDRKKGKKVPVPTKVVVGSQNIPQLRDAIAPHSFRKRKRDCLDIPEPSWHYRDVELTPEQAKAYREMRDFQTTMLETVGQCRTCLGAGKLKFMDLEQECWVCDGRGESPGANVSAQLAITMMLRLHQITTGHATDDFGQVHRLPSKRPRALLEQLEEINDQCVIWCTYRDDIARVAEEVRRAWPKKDLREFHGGVPQKNRDDAIDSFQRGDAQFFLGNPQSGGFGITLHAAQYAVYYSNNYQLELRLQSEARTDRAGQTRSPTYVDMRALGTVDEKIIAALRKKIDVGAAIMADGVQAWLR